MAARVRQTVFGAAFVAASMTGQGVAGAASKLPTFNAPLNTVLTVAIGCRIEDVKEIVLTNTSQATIPAGTVIGYDVVRYRSTSHYGGSVTSPRMPPGTQVRFGGEQSASCTAWYRPQLQRAP